MSDLPMPLDNDAPPRNQSLGIRTIAVMEAVKGALVVLVGTGLMLAIHKDLAAFAADVVRHFHLNPASRYPYIFLELAARTRDVPLALLAAGAAAYALLRFVEAYGLWRQRRWAEWLGAVSGAIYVPIELYELAEGVNYAKLLVLAVNLLVVIYLARRLQRRHGLPE